MIHQIFDIQQTEAFNNRLMTLEQHAFKDFGRVSITDFNDLTSAGLYYLNQNSIPSNAPGESRWCNVLVTRPYDANDAPVSQTVFGNLGIYTRRWGNASEGWRPWRVLSGVQDTISPQTIFKANDNFTLYTSGGGVTRDGQVLFISIAFTATFKMLAGQNYNVGYAQSAWLPAQATFIGNLDSKGLIEYTGQIFVKHDADIGIGTKSWLRGSYVLR